MGEFQNTLYWRLIILLRRANNYLREGDLQGNTHQVQDRFFRKKFHHHNLGLSIVLVNAVLPVDTDFC